RPRTVGGDVDRQVRVNLSQRLTSSFDAVGFANREDDRIAFDIEPGIADIRVAQRVAHIIDDQVKAIALGRGNIYLKQQIGTAAQVESKRHLLVRQPLRHLREKGRAEQ